MNVPGNSTLLLTLLAVFVACTGYAAGRLHQRYRTDRDREEAYRQGYDTATRSVFSLAARVIGPRREQVAVRASASVQGVSSTGRHTVPDELVQASTYRISSDRVARATVHEMTSAGQPPFSVPKPRS
jgi:hypothetical protein